MANRIKGITIEIGGDTTKLTDSLRDVNKRLKDTQTDLKDVNKLLKLDPSNTELLAQKHKLLGNAIKDTKAKLKEEQEALAQLEKQDAGTGKNQRQIEALRREIEDTTISLKNYQKQLKNSKNELDLFSEKAQKVADSTKLLSASAAAGIGGLVTLATKASATADELNTLAQQTGFSVEELQKFNYASELVDVSTEAITGSVKKLTANMSSGADVFKELGIEVTNIDGSLRNSTDVFYEVLQVLGQVENETQRDSLAMKVFGKSASELSGIIDDGGQKLKELGWEAQEAGLILSGEALQGAQEYNDAMEKLKATFSATMTEVGAKIAETLVPVLEQFSEIVQGLLQWIGNLDQGTIKLIETILLVTAAISPVAGAIAKITSAISNVSKLIASMSGTVIPAIASAVSTASASIVASLGGILPVLAAITAAGLGVIAIIDAIKQDKINKDWQEYTGSTANLQAISEREAMNWMNASEVKRITDPSGATAYYVDKSDYSWNKANAAANGWTDDSVWGSNAQTVNMTVNVDNISDLNDLLTIANQAQQYGRMG